MFGLITQIGLKLGAKQPTIAGLTIDLADTHLSLYRGTDGADSPLTLWSTPSPAHAAGLLTQKVENTLARLGVEISPKDRSRLGLDDPGVPMGPPVPEVPGDKDKAKGCYLKIWQAVCKRLAQNHGGVWTEIADALVLREAEIAQTLKMLVKEPEGKKTVPPGAVTFKPGDYFALTWEGQEISLLPEYGAMLEASSLGGDKVCHDKTLQGVDGVILTGNMTSIREGYNLGANINVVEDSYTDSWGLVGNAVERQTLQDKKAQRTAWVYLQNKELVRTVCKNILLVVIVEKDGVVDTQTSQQILQVLNARKAAEFLTLERVEEGFQVHIGIFIHQNKQLVMLQSWSGLSAKGLVQRAEEFRKQFEGKTLYNLMRASSTSVTNPKRDRWEPTDSRVYGVWLNRLLFGAKITSPEVMNAVFVLEHSEGNYADLKYSKRAASSVIKQWLREGNIMDVTQELGYKLGWMTAVANNTRVSQYKQKNSESLAKSIQTQFTQLQYQRNPQEVFARLLHLMPDSAVRGSIFQDRYETMRSEAVAKLGGSSGTFTYRVAYQEGLVAARREMSETFKRIAADKANKLTQAAKEAQKVLDASDAEDLEFEGNESVTSETNEGQE